MHPIRIFSTLPAALFAAVFAAAAAMADTPRPGLMWNRTGLPAVFPLQVKTPPGANYYLTLQDADTGEAALAAFIRGGAFFKVLVPPGTYTLRFASGQVWRDEDALFGPGGKTRIFDMPGPLTFRTRGHSTKAGHIVTINANAEGELASVFLKGQYICQSLSVEYDRAERPPWLPPPLSEDTVDRRFTGPSPKAADLSPFEPQSDPDMPYRVYSLTPDLSVRSGYCG